MIPAEPPTSPLASSVFATPAAHDWNATNTKSTIDKIPDTSFQVLIDQFLPFSSFLKETPHIYINAEAVIPRYFVSWSTYFALSDQIIGVTS